MKRIVCILFIVFSLQIVTGQDLELIRHEVQMGETVRMLSRKYKVEPSEIYSLNKFAVDGIRQGMILQILVPKKEQPVVQESATPVADNSSVTTSETATEAGGSTITTTTKTVTTTIRRKRQVTDESQVNTEAPASETGSLGTNSGPAITHTVMKGETLFSIAKTYNVSVDDIKTQNEHALAKGLQTGQVLTIIVNRNGVSSENVATNETASETSAKTETPAFEGPVTHTVGKGETLYSLSKKYNMPVDDIKALNEQILKNGLQVGQVLTIRGSN